jgi:uncharacterized protein YdhG (YjbR/CyaY superfamily)
MTEKTAKPEQAKPVDVDSYIASAKEEARPKLEELRKLIKATIPEAEEKIWYNVPFYHYHGELAGFDALKNHVSFGFGGDVLESADRRMLEEKGYKLGKMTMRIKFDQEVPTAAIKKILKTKAKMNESKSATK